MVQRRGEFRNDDSKRLSLWTGSETADTLKRWFCGAWAGFAPSSSVFGFSCGSFDSGSVVLFSFGRSELRAIGLRHCGAVGLLSLLMA